MHRRSCRRSTACRSASPITRSARRCRSRRLRSGANLFEKHFTASRSLPGPDQQGSMEPKELEALVKDIRAIERSLGATKKIQPGEQDVRNMALHSVVSIRDIAAGATIGADDVWVKRPGTGIPARQLGTSSASRRSARSRRTRSCVGRSPPEGAHYRVRSNESPRRHHGPRRIKGISGKNLQAARRKAAHRHTIDAACAVARVRSSDSLDRRRAIADGGARAAAATCRSCGPRISRATRRRICRCMQHAVEWLRDHDRYEPDAVMILQPTSPLRRAGGHPRVDRAARTKRRRLGRQRSARCPAHYNPMRTLRVDDDGIATLFVTGEPVRRRINRRQDMPAAWTMNGAIYVFRTGVLFGAAAAEPVRRSRRRRIAMPADVRRQHRRPRRLDRR